MAKQIKLEWQGKPYTLEFTRTSVKQMEQSGFSISDAMGKPMSAFPALFAGSFLAHHRFAKQNVIDEIFDNVSGKAGLIERLVEMYKEPFDTLMDDPEEENEKNVKWEASW